MIPRRKIEELLVRHQFEPTLKDIYVEGIFDKEVLTNCLAANNNTGYVVYEIDGIDINSNTLQKHGLSGGNKQRVIALAKELSAIKGDNAYRCIVDKDLDFWLNTVENIPRLNWTEHTSLELYFYTKKILNEILVISGRAKINDLDEFMKSLNSILKKLFSFRLADKKLQWNMEWIEPHKDISISGNTLNFNHTSYANRLLSKNKKLSQQKKFETESINWEKTLTGDPRSYIRGHDLVDLLAWSIKEFKGIKEIANSTTIERMLVLISTAVVEFLALTN
ncbi:DUF4435 domain-containing protein [Pseudomonas sp. Irchel 3A18]|uniref:DUF4435 domain-containing protein n=1 Tax=Pseudomonas sp. Irchel 3A18 TaxID=2008905 RepID=UPI001358CBC0|nr:DUF4435 domain-containing protein [Pseudomonas sp. Irchel 3A18]